MIVSMPSENNNRRSSVLPFDANSSHFALSTPAGGDSESCTSKSPACVAQGDVQPPLPRLSPPDAAQVGEIQEAIFEEKSSGFFYTKKSLFPSKSTQNRIIFGSPIRKSYIVFEMMTFSGSLY